MKTMSTEKIVILIVDDDSVIREMLEQEMKRNFFQTISASNGEKALEILGKEKIDIMLLDVKLPDKNGLEILEEIKEKKLETEIIVITGFGTYDIAVQSLKWGAIDYIEKPVEMSELHTALGRAQESLAKKRELDSKHTLLVIDDDKSTATRIKKFFEAEGYKAIAAFNGKEGLEAVKNYRIDVIISDINLGDMDGNELLREAKEIFQDIEGVMITGYADHQLAVKALRAGAFDYIIKPVDLDELLISVTKALERIKLNRNRLYRDRELKISAEIITRMNIELERKIEERTTELNQTQSQLFQASKLATLGEMSAGLAHEINQPLAGIMLILEYLRGSKKTGKLTDEEFEIKLDNIKKLGKRIDKTIKHMRAFARQDGLKHIEMNINEQIESVMNLVLGEQLRLREIEVIINLSPELPMIIGEPHQIEQVIINLISNARDALVEKENQILKKKLQITNYKKVLKISTIHNPDLKTVETIIQDNGIGMSNEVLDKIFVPFITTKETDKGSGLGMSISYGIIKNHNGKIEVESKECEGTTVQIILPEKGKGN